MTIKNDIAEHLPDPPSPNPMRRDAAIEAAMQRFDGKLTREMPDRSSIGGRGWAWLKGPQFNLAVSVTLIAIVCVPTIWTLIDQPVEVPDRTQYPEVATKAAPVEHMAFEPQAQQQQSAAERSPQDSVLPPPSEDRVPIASAGGEAARTIAEAPAAKPIVEPAKLARAEQVATAQPAPSPLTTAHMLQHAKSMNEAASADSTANEIIVTSGRSSRSPALPSRGAWNACTINDPLRDLHKCGREPGLRARAEGGSADASLAAGLGQAWRGRYDSAIADFDKAVAKAPDVSLAYLNRALAYQKLGDIDRAKNDFDLAIRYAPQSARAYYHRSQLYRALGDEKLAKADENKALEIDPNYAILFR